MALKNTRNYKSNHFTKRHYFIIGEIIAKCSDKSTVEDFIKYFKCDNDNFQEGVFREYLQMKKDEYISSKINKW